MLKLIYNITISKKNILLTIILLFLFSITLILSTINTSKYSTQLLNRQNLNIFYFRFYYLFITIFSLLNISIFLYFLDQKIYNELIAFLGRKKVFISKYLFFTVLSLIITFTYIFLANIISYKNIYFNIDKQNLIKLLSINIDNLIFCNIIMFLMRKNTRQILFLILSLFIIIDLIYVLIDIKNTNISFYYILSLSNMYTNYYNFIFSIFLLILFFIINYIKYNNEKINL